MRNHKMKGQAHRLRMTMKPAVIVSRNRMIIPHSFRVGIGEAARNLPSLLRQARMDVLPITIEHALAAGTLPGPHRDPFDRMLIAQGRLEALPIVTSDPAFKQYPVTIVW